MVETMNMEDSLSNTFMHYGGTAINRYVAATSRHYTLTLHHIMALIWHPIEPNSVAI